MLTAPKVQRPLPPEGTHIARCVRIIHLGTILEEYMGEQKEMNKIDITFELSEALHTFKDGDDPKPFVVSKEFTLSMGEKANLRKLIEGIIGTSLTQGEADAFDVESILDMPCLLSLKYKTSKAGNVRVEIASASPLMKGQEAKKPYNQPKLLTFSKWDEDYFDSLPDFLKEKISSSPEFADMKHSKDKGEKKKGTTAKPDYPESDPDAIPF
jgi:hypothetical protein